MNPLTDIHTDLLLKLRSCAPYGLPVSKLLTDLRTEGHRALALPALETAVRDLADRSFVALVDGALRPTWRITALGTSTLEEAGL